MSISPREARGTPPKRRRLGVADASTVLALDMREPGSMELLGRVCAALGISLVLTLLLAILYQDEGQGAQGPQEPPAITQASTAPALETP